MHVPLLTYALRFEHDLVGARQRARIVAAHLGFEAQDQSRIATAVSELARNALRYAGGGRVTFSVLGATPPQLLEVEVADQGPGIPHLAEVLDGSYRSTTGMGLGLIGTRRLMDRFSISATTAGTTVRIGKLLPARASLVGASEAQRIAQAVVSGQADTPLAEVEQQNRELLRVLDELRRRQDELVRLNRELEETNRGVVALYAELDEKADHLRRADELKSKFLSNMTHEFRTPVSSIIAISRILLDRLDGALTSEQDHQVRLIQHAAEDLSELVTDLLDLAKVEAGKTVIRACEFRVDDLCATLRGMLRPLLLNQSVALVFEDASELPPVYTDEGKVSQILRNFISNALKFTERGEVRVSARTVGGDRLALSVRDTGIGIAPEHLETIFQEFSQLEHPLQRKVRGTGLGLPLSRKLARLLGGDVSVESVPGAGSTFTLTVPMRFDAPDDAATPLDTTTGDDVDAGGVPVLVVEDAASDVEIYRSVFDGTEFDLHVAATSARALQVLPRLRPAVIILDVQLRGEHTWHLLVQLREHPDFADLPVLVVSALDDAGKGMALGATDYRVKPVDRDWLLARVREAAASRALDVWVISADDAWRTHLQRTLERLNACVVTAPAIADVEPVLRVATCDLICLGPDVPAAAVLDLLDRVAPERLDPSRIVLVRASGGSHPASDAPGSVHVIDAQALSTPAGTETLRTIVAAARARAGAQVP